MSQEKTITCNECGFEWPLNAVQIQEEQIKIENEKLRLSFFTCPKCNKIYRVALMDARYDELKMDLEKTKKRIRRNHGSNNQEMARMLNSMVFKKKQRLEEYVDKVNKMFPGTFTFVASENNHKEQTIKYLP